MIYFHIKDLRWLKKENKRLDEEIQLLEDENDE